MLGFIKRKKESTEAPESGTSFFARLKNGLSKTRNALAQGIAHAILGKKTIDDELYESLETELLIADVGIPATEYLIEEVAQTVNRRALKDPEALLDALKGSMRKLLAPLQQPLMLPKQSSPAIILMVGINGTGKTTTIGKLAKQLQRDGKSVMLAAGDTFRAAAIEQLQTWGARNAVPVIAQQPGSDSASVIYDAIESAKAKNIDVVIADTAGRLHTQQHLMDELHKIVRVIQKSDPNAPHEVLLTLDASMGQNALTQAKEFHQAVTLSGICITKLDGTAKGGVIFAIAKDLGLPIKYIGIGEGIDDLRPFEADAFVDALFA